MRRRRRGGAFATLDPRFIPLARRFGLSPLKLPDIALNDPAGSNARALRERVEEAGATAVFIGASIPSPVIREWESRLGMPVLPLAMVGSSSTAGHSTYLDLLEHNLEQLATGSAPTSQPAPSRSRP